MKVLKYDLPRTRGWHDITLPAFGYWMKVEVQYNEPVVYIVCNSEDIVKTVPIYVAFTGSEIPEELDEYFSKGTAILDEGTFALHYFV